MNEAVLNLAPMYAEPQREAQDTRCGRSKRKAFGRPLTVCWAQWLLGGVRSGFWLWTQYGPKKLFSRCVLSGRSFWARQFQQETPGLWWPFLMAEHCYTGLGQVSQVLEELVCPVYSKAEAGLIYTTQLWRKYFGTKSKSLWPWCRHLGPRGCKMALFHVEGKQELKVLKKQCIFKKMKTQLIAFPL